MSVEIRSYEGDGSDLAALVSRCWRTSFEGRMWFPLWDHAYFRWRLLEPSLLDREFLVAAYRGSKLVGCLLAEAVSLELAGETLRGTLSSFLSVDPELRNPLVGIRLLEGLRARHRAHGMALSLGYTSTNRELPNRRFWESVARRDPRDVRFLQPLQFWLRVLDGPTVAGAGLTPLERSGPLLAARLPWASLRGRGDVRVRSYQPADAPRCLGWLQQQASGATLRMRWNLDRLRVQLGEAGYARTLIAEDERGRGAFLNYYPIAWAAARPLQVGWIDLCAGDLGALGQAVMLRAAAEMLRDEGCALLMMAGSKAAPAPALMAAGFIPFSAGIELISVFDGDALKLAPPVSFHVPFT